MKAESIQLLRFKKSHMQVFHLTWMTFFGWFGSAPLMAIVRKDLDLAKKKSKKMFNMKVKSESLALSAV